MTAAARRPINLASSSLLRYDALYLPSSSLCTYLCRVSQPPAADDNQ